MEWKAVLFNGLETNVEVTKCGRVRKVKVNWINCKTNIGEFDFNKLKLHKNGYKQINAKIKNYKHKSFFVHQLVAAAFLDYKFQGHKMVVDHIDSNKLNNHIDNLRVITHRENTSKERSIKKGLPVGVSFDRNKYKSRIIINNKLIHLGLFKTIEEASYAYQEKLKTI